MQQKYYNKKHYFREFYKRDFILLNAKNLWTLRFSKKLLHRYSELFYVKEPVRMQVYCLSLLILYWIYSVFHVSLLELYKSRGGEKKVYMFESIIINEHDEYEIEEILNKKNAKSELWYKIKWLKWL